MTRAMLAIGTFAFLSACSFVEPIPGSDRIILSNDMESCTKIAETTVTVLDEIAGIDRTEQAIQEELEILARNQAFKKKANAIWPVTKIENGTRTYHLLRCKPNNG